MLCLSQQKFFTKCKIHFPKIFAAAQTDFKPNNRNKV